VYFREVIGRKSADDLHSSYWYFQLIEMSMGTFKAVMYVYISYKFGGFLSNTSAVNVAELCTAGIDQHSA